MLIVRCVSATATDVRTSAGELRKCTLAPRWRRFRDRRRKFSHKWRGFHFRAGNDGKEGVWRAIVVDGQIVGSISVERKADEQRNAGSIGYMILTPFWSQGIGTDAVRQICGIAFRELALERIIGEVFPENLASARVLEKNGFRLEETKPGAVVKGGKAMDVKVYGFPR